MPEGFARHTESSVQNVIDLCMEDPDCVKAFPDLEGNLTRLKARLAQGPITATYKGRKVPVRQIGLSALLVIDGPSVPTFLQNVVPLVRHEVTRGRVLDRVVADGPVVLEQ